VLLVNFTLQANEETDAKIVADCKKIGKYASLGDKYYKQKQFTKARVEYQMQVGWAETCKLSREYRATAYNNVALTYIHQGEYLKANFWFSLLKEDKKSIYNREKYKAQIEKAEKELEGSYVGEYWGYSGKAMLDSIVITKKGDQYNIFYDGYYVPRYFMYYGPNMGEFSADVTIENNYAQYIQDPKEYTDCTFEFTFKDSIVDVKQTPGGSWTCGFGHNVYAGGTYYRVKGK
jgi:hypothetical protein